MIYIKDMDMPVDCLACQISCKHESYMVTGRPEDCPLEEAKTGDLIRRADAIEAVCGVVIDEFDVPPTKGYDVAVKALSALPSAEAVSREEHIKELNDLAVAWKAKFAKAEKITDEIYAETMAKVAKECEECKERLLNIRPSAEAEGSLKAIKRQIDEHWYLDAPSAEAVQLKQTDTLIIADALRYLAKDEERHLSDRTRADALMQQLLQYGASMCHSAEAVQGFRGGKIPPKEVLDGTVLIPQHQWLEMERKLAEYAEAVQGEWIKTADGNSWNEWGVLTCPLCGASIEDKYYHSWKYNFCPNCGARMSKGGDSE